MRAISHTVTSKQPNLSSIPYSIKTKDGETIPPTRNVFYHKNLSFATGFLINCSGIQSFKVSRNVICLLGNKYSGHNIYLGLHVIHAVSFPNASIISFLSICRSSLASWPRIAANTSHLFNSGHPK